MIRQGRVTINGLPTKPGNRVMLGDTVLLDGKPLLQIPTPLYIAFNKPIGIVCTTDTKKPNNIISYINHPQRLFPIGRLDKPSEGLIFLTNDGDIVNKILRAHNEHEKEYVVKVDKIITKAFLRNMAKGVKILNTVTKKCKVRKINDQVFTIILTQGLNRQIRRMCRHLGYEVIKLKRIRIMNVSLGNLKSGKWRILTDSELNVIKRMVSSSSKTQEVSKVMDRKKGNQ